MAVQSLLDRQLLPAFGSKPLDRITLAHITRWFDRFSWTAPGNANHALDLLTQIISFAIARGHLETNTARAVKRNRRPVLTRFLSREEIHADVDGDGLGEFVPHDDRIGPRPPERTYELFATSTPLVEPGTEGRFYIGGDIYEGWSAVPDRYMASDFERPAREFKLFTFSF